MSDPIQTNNATTVGDPAYIRDVATYQKAIMYCILAIFTSYVMIFALPQPINAFGGLLYLLAGITALVFVFILSIKLYNVGLGILLGFLTILPLVGLIVLLIVNQKATNLLKSFGVDVGLMGAKKSTLPQVNPLR